MGDVIYTDAHGISKGVLKAYEIDIDTADTKDFELKIHADEVMLDLYAYWYIEGEEYGGVIKTITADSDSGEVTYGGPNPRGILEDKIVQPDGKVSEVYSGSFADILTGLIAELNLSAVFAVDPDAQDFTVPSYTMDGYQDAYELLTGMCADCDKSLRFRWASDDDGCICYVSAEQISDFSDWIKFGAADCAKFEIAKEYGGTNHVIATATDDDGEIYVIHVFADEGGGVQPYATEDTPIYDSDYILTEDKKVMTGIKEVVELCECDNNPTTNYVLQAEKPDDWTSSADAYYTYEETEDEDTGETTESYKSVEWSTETSYVALTSKPSGWSTDYGSYYVEDDDADDGYSSVSGTESTTYKRIYKKPKDWKTSYSDYCYYYYDGVSASYESVSGVSYNRYKLQTKKPSDWQSGYDAYYYRKTTTTKKNGKKTTKTTWESVTKKLMKKGWRKNKYYTKYSYTRAPAWKSSLRYYIAQTETTAPTWKSGTYYEQASTKVAPTWTSGTYYTAVLDHYASLVESAVDILEDSGPSESATMSLSELDVQMGDIVGGYDKTTGLEINEPVTNIIYKNTNGTIEIEYTIGGESGTDEN